MNTKENLYGPKGWLLFFIICIAFISPLIMLLVTTFNLYTAEAYMPLILNNPNWEIYKIMSYGLVIGCIIWQLKAGHSLYYKFIPSSIKQVKILLVVLPITIGLVDYLAVNFILNIQVESSYILAVLKQILWNMVWFLYFTYSVRVKNTYLTQVSTLVDPNTMKTSTLSEEK